MNNFKEYAMPIRRVKEHYAQHHDNKVKSQKHYLPQRRWDTENLNKKNHIMFCSSLLLPFVFSVSVEKLAFSRIRSVW